MVTPLKTGRCVLPFRLPRPALFTIPRAVFTGIAGPAATFPPIPSRLTSWINRRGARTMLERLYARPSVATAASKNPYIPCSRDIWSLGESSLAMGSYRGLFLGERPRENCSCPKCLLPLILRHGPRFDRRRARENGVYSAEANLRTYPARAKRT